MRWANPSAFYLLLLVPALLGFFAVSARRRRKALSRLGDPDLLLRLTASASPARDRLKSGLFLAALFLLTLALARPQWGERSEDVVRSGVDLFLAIDTSLSMDASDVSPSRLERARLAAASLVERLEGNRIGLIPFAGGAFVACPLTLDTGAARMFLDALSTGMVPEPGTNIARALETAMEGFAHRQSRFKVLVLITDGEQHEGDSVGMAEKAREEGVVVYAIGVGTPSGEPIPVRGERGEIVEYKRDASGNPVLSRLDEDTLQRVALATGGEYFRAGERGSEIDAIAERIAAIEGGTVSSRLFRRYEERYHWPLGIALLLLTAEALIPRRKPDPARRPKELAA